MEKNKSKNNVILLLVVIIILLFGVVIFMVAKSTKFNKDVDNNMNFDTDESVNNKLTNEEAITIVETLFNNKTVQYLVDNPAITYCDIDPSFVVSEEELGLDYEWNGYNKCRDYNTYEELSNYFKSFFTEDFYNDTILKNSPYVAYSNKHDDGSVLYNYYEKDGNLYAANTGKGSNVMKDKFLSDKTSYKIVGLYDDKFVATIDAKWLDANGEDYSEFIKIMITNDDNNWKISSYEIDANSY